MATPVCWRTPAGKFPLRDSKGFLTLVSETHYCFVLLITRAQSIVGDRAFKNSPSVYFGLRVREGVSVRAGTKWGQAEHRRVVGLQSLHADPRNSPSARLLTKTGKQILHNYVFWGRREFLTLKVN